MQTRFLTRYQVAEILAVSVGTVDGLIRRGEIPAVRVGSSVRVSEEGLSEFVQKHGAGRVYV